MALCMKKKRWSQAHGSPLTNPTASEILEIADACQIDPDHLKAPLDEEERSRIEAEDEYTLILVDIPSIEERKQERLVCDHSYGDHYDQGYAYNRLPGGDPCPYRLYGRKSQGLPHIYENKGLSYRSFIKNATQYLQYLRIIDKKSEVIENKLHQSQKNEELIELLELQKSLVYFTTSLRSNEVVLEKLLRIDKIKKYPEDTDLLEDVIVENKQAMEMTSIYNGILSGTMDTFASVISNNLNIVMKFLATVTIVMSIPTMIASFYGMNVRASGMPFAESPYGFGIVLFFTLLLTLIVAYIFNKKDLF